MKTTQNLLRFLRATVAGLLFACALSSPAQVTQILFADPGSGARNNYTGGVGTEFVVNPTNDIVVSHLGYFDLGADGLTVSHNVGLFTPPNASPVLIGSVTVPAGTGAYYTNGFRWVKLTPPLLLKRNTTNFIAGLAGNLDGDAWRDGYAANWNSNYFVGGTATTTRHALYGPGNVTWPPVSLTRNGNDNTYGAACLGYIEEGQALAGVGSTNVAGSAGAAMTVVGFGAGQKPITYQWFTAGGTLLAGKTNANLTFANPSVSDSGNYYLTATNALGGGQSPTVTLTITAIPVGISQHPTNLTVFANYQASFFTTATGTPPISYQWSRNGTPITGATASSYSLTASTTNNGDVYSCLASNVVSGTPFTAVSSNATLTVNYNLAPVQQLLHGAPTGNVLNRSDYSGTMGGHFTVGASPVTVTHLGYFAPTNQYVDPTNATLTQSHQVGVFGPSGVTLFSSVTIAAGTYPVVNGYIWTALNPPLVLATNTQYLLMAEVFAGVDPYPDTRLVPDLNPSLASACNASYGNAWPAVGNFGNFASQMYGAPNLGILAPPTPVAFASPTTVTQYVGFNTTFSAQLAGKAPVSVQWYKQPGTLLTGKTNLTLTLSNLNLGDAGNYYFVATNTQAATGAQSPDATLTVIPDVGPSLTQDILPQTAYLHQTVRFVAAADGTPVLSYQWQFNGSPITAATNSTLILTDVSPASVGNYQLTVTNPYAPFTVSSAIASLTVRVPDVGSYPAAVMSTNLLAYYRFSDVNDGPTALNQGSLGTAFNGTYENLTSIAGPLAPNFESTNLAVALDGLTTDVLIPPLGVTLTNGTFAAWVYQANGQPNDSTIFYQRGTLAAGLSVGPDLTNSSTQLKVTWASGSFNNQTFLDLPTNQWTFVAMTVNPTNLVAYMQDGVSLKSTNFAGTYAPQTFTGNSYVGWDTPNGAIARRWTGNIDEVMVFDRALSASEINALYLGIPSSANLTIERAGNNVVLKWTAGQLLEASGLTGPWTTNTATSPYTTPTSATQKFYRVRLQP